MRKRPPLYQPVLPVPSRAPQSCSRPQLHACPIPSKRHPIELPLLTHLQRPRANSTHRPPPRSIHPLRPLVLLLFSTCLALIFGRTLILARASGGTVRYRGRPLSARYTKAALFRFNCSLTPSHISRHVHNASLVYIYQCLFLIGVVLKSRLVLFPTSAHRLFSTHTTTSHQHAKNGFAISLSDFRSL